MDESTINDELKLEDIMAEFGDPEVSPEEDVRLWGQEDAPVASAPQDTVRLDQIAKAVRQQEDSLEQTVSFAPLEQTIAFEPLEQTIPFEPLEQTIAFEPVKDEQTEDDLPLIAPDDDLPPKAEPYSEDWKPEFEEPIHEYVPPEPIVHRPKSRLRELKRKLVAGPEKRYYDLMELGLGKLQVAIFANLIIALISAGATALYTLGAVPADRMRLLIFVQFLTLLLSGLLGSYQLLEGFGDMLRLRFSLNSLLIFSLLACVVDGVLCLQSMRVPCCAVFSLHMTMALWSAYHKRNTEMGQMDTMRRASRLDGIVAVPDYYEGRTGFLRMEGQVEDFMNTYNQPSGVEKTLSVYALVALFLSLAIGITAGVLHGAELGVQAFSAALLISVPATSYICISRPMAVLERRLHRLGAVLCGWDGVEGLSQKGVFPLTDADLHPAGSAKMNGVKIYGSREKDMVLAYATALIGACGGGTADLFNEVLDEQKGYHFTAKDLRSYPAGGVGGEVNGEPVLAGTLRFMQEMSIEIPEGMKIKHAVYVAIDGEICGVFVISYSKIRTTAAAMTTLCAYRGLNPVLTTTDFVLTENFIRSRFGVKTKRIGFPERADRCRLAEIQPEEGTPAMGLFTQEGLAGPAFLVTGARTLRKACRLGVAVHMLGGILGLVMMLLLGILGAAYLLTPGNVLLYQLIWMIPGLLFTEWARSV